MFEIGKIPPEVLEKIVMKPMMGSKVKREDVILRPTTGEDCSAIDLGGEICILSTDPITGAAKDIGYLAVQINCNDVYSSGAEPMGVLLTVLLPPGSDEELLEEINALGIGPQGFGGATTALAVNIETFPTHIAGLPVAVNINCHVTRHKTEVL